MNDLDYLRAQAELKAEERQVMWEVMDNMAEADGWSHEAYQAMFSYFCDSIDGRPAFA
jgi:hypothetical protein